MKDTTQTIERDAQTIAQPIIDYYREHGIIPDRFSYNTQKADGLHACAVGVLALMNGAEPDTFVYHIDTGLARSQSLELEAGFCDWSADRDADGEPVEPVYYRAGQLVYEAVL